MFFLRVFSMWNQILQEFQCRPNRRNFYKLCQGDSLIGQRGEDAIRFFKKNINFFHIHTKGSHMFYFVQWPASEVCVPFHGKRVLKPRTLKGIIQQSEFPKEWLKN